MTNRQKCLAHGCVMKVRFPASPLLPGWADTGRKSKGQLPFFLERPPSSFPLMYKGLPWELPKHTLSVALLLICLWGTHSSSLLDKTPLEYKSSLEGPETEQSQSLAGQTGFQRWKGSSDSDGYPTATIFPPGRIGKRCPEVRLAHSKTSDRPQFPFLLPHSRDNTSLKHSWIPTPSLVVLWAFI